MPLEQCDLPSSTYELLQRSTQRHGQRIALSCLLHNNATGEPLRASYAELFTHVAQTANVLHQLSLESHQAVSFLLSSLSQTHYMIWGDGAAGTVNATNPLLESEHAAELIRTSDTRVLVTLASFPGTDLWRKVAGLHARLPELYAIVVIDPANLLPTPQREALKAQCRPLPEDMLDFDTLIVNCPVDRLESERVIRPGNVAPYFHTGGTTGTSKLAPHSHFNEVAMAGIMGLNTDYRADNVLPYGLPLFHVNGVMVTGLTSFHRGAQMSLAGSQGHRNPALIQDFWKLVEHYRVTSFSGVSTIYAALLQVPGDGRDLFGLRFTPCGVTPMSAELIRQFEARTELKVIEGYGLTEGTYDISYNPRGGERRPGLIDLRLSHCQVKVTVLDGESNYLRNAAPNEVGNLCLKGPMMFKGYPQQDRNCDIWIGDGWFNAGDLGRVDEDGYTWLTGRSKDLIIRGGHNIDPQIIEEALYRHLVAALATAVDKLDVKAGELSVAYIQFKSGVNASGEELLEHASRHIPERAAAPKDVWLVKSMPVTTVGKTFKPALCLDATRRVLEEESRKTVEDIHVEVVTDERRGQLAHLHVPTLDERRRATLEELLGGCVLNYWLHAARKKLYVPGALAQLNADAVDFLQGHLVIHRVVMPVHLHALRL